MIKWNWQGKKQMADKNLYRLAWAEWKEKEYKIVVEKMLWKGKAEYIYGKLVTRPGISFDICLSAGNSWGWTYNIATEEEAQEVIRRKQAAHINSGF